MSDFSVGRKSVGEKEITFATGRKSEFTELKNMYIKQQQQIETTDFANSPVAIKNELEMLGKMKVQAKKEKLTGEMAWIDKREVELKEKLTQSTIDSYVNAFYKPIITPYVPQEEDLFEVNEDNDELFEVEDTPDELLQLLNSCKKTDGTFDENAARILDLFKESDDSIYNMRFLLDKCRIQDGSIPDDRVMAVGTLLNSGISVTAIPQFLDEYSETIAESDAPVINLARCLAASILKNEGLSDLAALKFEKYLNGDFENKEQIKSNLLMLNSAGIAPESAIKIMDSLRVRDVKTGASYILPSSVKNIVSLKKSLARTRDNEQNERNSAIANIGVKKLECGSDTIIFKNGKIVATVPNEKFEPEVVKERYSSMLSSMEDEFLMDFISKYKDANGMVNTVPLRVMNSLRTAGVAQDRLFEITDLVLGNDGSINRNALASIEKIKKAGALSSELEMLLSHCDKLGDGLYNPDTVDDICDLTSAVIGASDVCALLPKVKDNGALKKFIMCCSPCFDKKENIHKLVSIVENSNGEYDDTSTEVVYNLAKNIFENYAKNEATLQNFNYSQTVNNDADVDNVQRMDENQFLEFAKQVLNMSKDEGNINTGDNAAGVVSILCSNKATPDDIIKGLELCSNENGIVDYKLSEILWAMGVQNASMEEMSALIGSCKNEQNVINADKADMILSLFEAGYPKEKISSLVLH